MCDSQSLRSQRSCTHRTAESNQGVFITFEGGEGAGKSTHIAFLARCLREAGREVVCLREPGGTSIGEALRALVLDPRHAEMSPRTELLIYEAARAQIVAQVIAPALDRGAVVLCDRFFDSTVAYQSGGRGLSREFVHAANAFACQGVVPQRTILMVSATAKEGLERATHEGADRIEQAGVDFHARVNAEFLEIAQAQPQRVRVVLFAESKAETAQRVYQQVKDLFPDLEQAAAGNEAFFRRIEEH